MKIEVSIVADDTQVLNGYKNDVAEFVNSCFLASKEFAMMSAKANAAKASFESDKFTIRVKIDSAFCELVRNAENKK